MRRINSGQSSPKQWCDLTAAELKQVLALAAESGVERTESRDEWLLFTIGDENGSIAPGGLARALEQRQALVRPSRPEVAIKGTIGTMSAGLPGSPSGWTSLTGYIHPVGRINDLLIHPTSTTTMWAGADGGGIWKTTDGGTTWQAANDFLGSLSVSSFAMRPADPSTIYAATGAQGAHTKTGGAGVFKSTDGGTTWTPLPATSPVSNVDWQYTYQLAIHPTDSNTVIAATDGGAYITTSGGTAWTEIPAAATRARNVAIHPLNGNLRVIAMDDGTVRICTDGATFNSYTIATVTGSSYTRIALSRSNQNIMYALLSNGGNTQLYRSSTGGTTWTSVAVPAGFFYNSNYLYYTGGLWVDPTNPDHIAVVEGWAAVTSDASLPTPTWSESCCGWVDFHGAISHPAYNGTTNKQVFFFDDGGLYRWTDVDTLATTSPAYLSPNGINVTEVYTVSGRGGNVVLGAQDVASRFYRTASPDLTQKWRFAAPLGGHDGAATAADRTNSNTLYGSTQYLGIHRSLDGGTNTAWICQGITDISCSHYSGTAAFIAPFLLDPNNQSRMLAGAASLWRSNDVSSGNPPTWTAIKASIGSNISAIAIAPSDSNIIWVAHQNGTVYKTVNGTAAAPVWTQVTTVPAGNKLHIYIDRTNANRVYLGLSGFLANRLVVTPDGGTNWSPVAGLPSASVFAMEQHPLVSSWLYVGTAVGLFASEDGGATWSTTNEGPANVQVRDLSWYSEDASSAVLLVGTFGRGVWRATLSVGAAPAAPTGLLATGPTAVVCGPPPEPASKGLQPASQFDWAPCTGAVTLSWNPVSGATYKIFRSSSLFAYAQVGTSASPSYTDSAPLGAAYLYMVRATNGAVDSPDSNADLAITMPMSDSPLSSGMPVRALHINNLRDAVNAVRTLAGLGAGTFEDPALSAGMSIRRVHITDLRSALDAARAALMLNPAVYTTDPTITSNVTPIRAAHINELRDGVQ